MSERPSEAFLPPLQLDVYILHTFFSCHKKTLRSPQLVMFSNSPEESKNRFNDRQENFFQIFGCFKMFRQMHCNALFIHLLFFFYVLLPLLFLLSSMFFLFPYTFCVFDVIYFSNIYLRHSIPKFYFIVTSSKKYAQDQLSSHMQRIPCILFDEHPIPFKR